jgi:hypothetical protein
MIPSRMMARKNTGLSPLAKFISSSMKPRSRSPIRLECGVGGSTSINSKSAANSRVPRQGRWKHWPAGATVEHIEVLTLAVVLTSLGRHLEMRLDDIGDIFEDRCCALLAILVDRKCEARSRACRHRTPDFAR